MIELAEAKLHLHVDESDDVEDEAIQNMIDAAVQHLASIGIDMTAEPLPAPLKQAALMAVADFYETRGMIESDKRLSPAFWRLVQPYREIEL